MSIDTEQPEFERLYHIAFMNTRLTRATAAASGRSALKFLRQCWSDIGTAVALDTRKRCMIGFLLNPHRE